jgi:16S rRNA (guanine966-N2)-methyltransferase
MATQAYDIVFIDPPFMQQLVGPICEALAKKQLLSNDALVYVETGAMEPPPEVPLDWNLHREKVAGGVAYRLFSVD